MRTARRAPGGPFLSALSTGAHSGLEGPNTMKHLGLAQRFHKAQYREGVRQWSSSERIVELRRELKHLERDPEIFPTAARCGRPLGQRGHCVAGTAGGDVMPAVTRDKYMQVSPSKADDGQKVGLQPTSASLQRLRALGHPESPIKTIRAKCLDCCGGAASEVRKCTSIDCPLWAFRMGRNPFHARAAGRIRALTGLGTENFDHSRGASPRLEKSPDDPDDEPHETLVAPAVSSPVKGEQ